MAHLCASLPCGQAEWATPWALGQGGLNLAKEINLPKRVRSRYCLIQVLASQVEIAMKTFHEC